jgi:hypothetical protein
MVTSLSSLWIVVKTSIQKGDPIMKDSSIVHLTYTHPTSGEYIREKFDTVELMLLCVKSMRKHFKKVHKLTLRPDYFSWKVVGYPEGPIDGNA